MKKIRLFSLIFFVTLSQSKAQSTFSIKFSYYSTANGLTSTNVRKTIQDPLGFMWLATQDGLFRFDGNRFTIYNSSLSGNHAITGIDIRDMVIHKNILWLVNSYGGIDAIDIFSGNVIYQYDQQKDERLKTVLFLSILAKGDSLYIGTDKGLYLFDFKRKAIDYVNLNHSSSGIVMNINKLIIDNENNLWVLCAFQGIWVVNPDKLTALDFYRSDSLFFYDCDKIESNIITATNSGVRQFQFKNKRITQLSSSQFLNRFDKEEIFSLKKDKNQNIWFSTKNHLVKANIRSEKLDYVSPGKLFNGKDWTSSVFGIYLDKTDNLWLSCQEGLAYAQNRPAEFICYTKDANSPTQINHSYYLFPFKDSLVWVCAENGLYKVNLETKSISLADKGKSYFYIFENFDGNLIVSNDEGSFILDNYRLTRLDKAYPEFRSFGAIVFNSRVPVNDSSYILGTQNNKGVFFWNYKSKQVRNITVQKGLGIKDDHINAIYKEDSSVIWILTDNSVSLYLIKEKKFKQLIILNPVNQKEYTIFLDIHKINHRYYLASYGNGIVILDSQYNFIKELSSRNGLANNGVYKLLPYKDSLLFATSNNGLSVIDPANGKIKNLYTADGLHSDVFEELSGNAKNNIIYAGGLDGFTVIRPDFFSTNTTPPTVSINNVRIETEGSITDTTNFDLQKVRVPHNSKQVTIYFSGLSFSNPLKTVFSYKILEIHNDWINQGNQNFVTLIGLSPGTYHLQVRALNEDQIPGEIKELILIFLPKWYQTWWFKLLMFVLAVAIIYSLYHFRINQLKKEQRIRSKLASDLHDDLGSTMNSVKVYANLAILKPEEKYLLKIKESTQEAITGIKDIIWVLDDSKDSMEHLLSRINIFVSPLCEAHNINYRQELHDDARDYKLGQEERRNLYMMLKEAINNAIKHADAQTIEIEISINKDKPSICIKDDGNGFDTTKASSGNGILNLKRRAKEIKYKIVVQSAAGNGTTINFHKT